jgi:uncharacterized protein YidB (DUF937 family)
MSLLDTLTGSLKSMFSQSGDTSDQSVLGSVLASSGGMQSIMEKLHAGGMGDIVSSWTSGGSCQSISTDQLRSALGNEHVEQIASKLGVSPDQALSALAEHLPGLAAAQTKH